MKTATGPYKYSLLDPENPAETLEATTFAVFDLDDSATYYVEIEIAQNKRMRESNEKQKKFYIKTLFVVPE